MKKATTEEIIAAYKDTGSVWKAGKQLGMCGQSVWERLRALGYDMLNRNWTDEEISELRSLVETCTLSDTANRLGRPYAGVACMASRLGITTRFGNRQKRKVPRGSGLTKVVVTKLVTELRAWDGTIRQFCRGRGLDVNLFANAVQVYEPDAWKLIAWQKGLPEKECPNCGSTFYPMTAKQATCTRRCAAQHKSNMQYFGGRRNEAIGLREGICQLCGAKKPSLQVHHMLGKENDADNEFLVALCAGCHHLVGIAASRKILDTDAGWERFIELVMARRLAEQETKFFGTHVSVDIEYLTRNDIVDLAAVNE